MLERLLYQAGHFSTLLLDLQTEGTSGSIYIDTIENSQKKPTSRVLVLQKGEIVYGGLAIPSNNREFAQLMGIKLNHSFVNTAIKYAEQKLKNPSSFRELLERIVQIRAFKWDEIESIVHAQVMQVLEYAFSHPGQLRLDATVTFDLSYVMASNAVDALKVINTNPIALLLLDVTMPDIDGLECCRTVRRIGKVNNLPIIMLTVRDKFSDKYRGQIAGATHYLTKPVEPTQLLQIVDRCVNPSNIISFA